MTVKWNSSQIILIITLFNPYLDISVTLHSFIYINHFILVRLSVDLEHIMGKLSMR